MIAGKRAALHQSLDSGKIDLRLVRLRLQRVDLRVQRLHLQRELLVADRRDRLAARDRIAFADVELDDGAADAPARRHHADALDGGEHRLLVGDRPRGDRQAFRAPANGALNVATSTPKQLIAVNPRIGSSHHRTA